MTWKTFSNLMRMVKLWSFSCFLSSAVTRSCTLTDIPSVDVTVRNTESSPPFCVGGFCMFSVFVEVVGG